MSVSRSELTRMIADTSRVPEVRVRGEALSEPVVWSGRQWAVTSHGVEARDGTYAIEASRLWEEDAPGYTWERHMAEKEWVDVPDLAAALALGRQHHADKRPVSP